MNTQEVFHVIFKSNINFYSRLCFCCKIIRRSPAERTRTPVTRLFSSSVSLSSSLLLFLLSPSFTSLSLSLWQTEGWWVCCRSNSSIQPRSVGAGSFARWRHTNTTVFPRRDDLVVSVRKQNEARQHEHPPPPSSSLPPPPSLLRPPSLRPSIRPSSLRLSAMLARMLITHSGRKDNRRVKTNEWSLTIIAPPASRLSSPSGCFCSQMFVVCGFIEMRWNVIDRGGEAKKWPGAGEQERDERRGETWSAQKADEDVSASVSVSLPVENKTNSSCFETSATTCAHLTPTDQSPLSGTTQTRPVTSYQEEVQQVLRRRRPLIWGVAAVLQLCEVQAEEHFDWTMLKETGSKLKSPWKPVGMSASILWGQKLPALFPPSPPSPPSSPSSLLLVSTTTRRWDADREETVRWIRNGKITNTNVCLCLIVKWKWSVETTRGGKKDQINQMFAKPPKNIREEEKEENGRSTTAVLSSGSERSMQTFSLTPPELSDLLFLSGADILNHQRTWQRDDRFVKLHLSEVNGPVRDVTSCTGVWMVDPGFGVGARQQPTLWQLRVTAGLLLSVYKKTADLFTSHGRCAALLIDGFSF